MECPGCRSEMKRVTVDAVLGVTVDIDVCSACRAFWFEPYETLHLTPGSTLELFRMIANASRGGGAVPAGDRWRCPQCGGRLLLTHDRQRNTPFQYWRCDRGHGRFTSFTDFLKEKNFIQPLSAQQIAELRRNVRMINCTNCGAPVDIVKDSVCHHCGSPLAMLDMVKMAELGNQYLRAATTARTRPSPALPRPVMRDSSSSSLLDFGLRAVADWLDRLLA